MSVAAVGHMKDTKSVNDKKKSNFPFNHTSLSYETHECMMMVEKNKD